MSLTRPNPLPDLKRIVLPRRGAAFGACLLSLFALASPLAAQRTDTVTLLNGNRITGEIKELERGKLKYKTDDMGTIYIEWGKIARLTSRQYHEVELASGRRYYGNFAPSAADGRLVVALTPFADTLEMLQIVEITPIRETFWTRLDGSVDLGFSYTSATSIIQLSLSSSSTYRGERYYGGYDLSVFFQDTDSSASTSRASLTLNAQRFLMTKWSAGLFSKVEQNEELNLDLRTYLGGGGIWFPIQTNHSTLRAGGGPLVSREQFTADPEPLYSLEFLLGGRYEAFRFDDPELDVTVDLSVTPSITNLGRIRIEFNATARYELISDFFLGLTLYDQYDNRADAGEGANDFATTLSIGYSW